MERLLADAGKISGVKYDISSFADVTQAIHVMQTEMGIAGTTAKEAEGTIQGSLDSMKSAWQNLITGLGDKNVDLSPLIKNVVDSAKTFGKNLLPIIQQALEGVGQLIAELLPQILTEIPSVISGLLPRLMISGVEMLQAILQGLTDSMPKLSEGLFAMIQYALEGLKTLLPQLLQFGFGMIISIANGLTSNSDSLINNVLSLILSVVDTILNNLPALIDAGINMVVSLGVGLINALPGLVEKLPLIITKIIEVLFSSIPKIAQAGVTLLLALVKNLPAIIWGIVKAIPTIIVAIIDGFISYVSSMQEVGRNLIKGLWEGIKSVEKWLKDKIAGFFGGVVDSIKDFFGIHSPSTLMRDDIGWFAGLGVGVGFEKSMGVVKKQMNSSLNGVIGSMQKSVAIDTSVAGTSKVVYANNIEQDTNARTSQLDLKTAVANAFENTKVVLDKREVGRILVVKGA